MRYKIGQVLDWSSPASIVVGSLKSLAPTKFTCDSKNFDFAITTTNMLPMATDSNQQACSTDFILCGA
uniref:Uncharacterized protein n=1 Tax=Glossina pallidipes TaxID=7398 RepID=A0A1A9Z200_GLOPL